MRQRICEFSQDDHEGGEEDEDEKGTIGALESQATEKRISSTKSVSFFEQLGFKQNLKYGPRSKLRKSCSRFLRFSYLLDFIALETLANIYVDSVKDTIIRIRDVAAIKPDLDLKKVVKNALGEVV